MRTSTDTCPRPHAACAHTRTNVRKGTRTYLNAGAGGRREGRALSRARTRARTGWCAAVEREAVAPKAEEERGVFDEQLFEWYRGITIAVLVFRTSIVMVVMIVVVMVVVADA